MTYANGFGHDPRRLHSVQRNVSSVRASSNANRVDSGVRIDTTPDPRGSICRAVRCTLAEHLRGLSSHIIAAAISRAGVTALSIANAHDPQKVRHGITKSAVESTSLATAKPYGAKGFFKPQEISGSRSAGFPPPAPARVPAEGLPPCPAQRVAVSPLLRNETAPILTGGSGGFISHPLRPFIRFITSLTGQTFQRPTCRTAVLNGGSSVHYRTADQHDRSLKVLIGWRHLSSSSVAVGVIQP
jgi:hypothetical protein